MSYITIKGNRPLVGEVTVQGAKNSVLPILAASLLCRTPSYIHGCPRITDVQACSRILNHLGCRIKREDDCLMVDATTLSCTHIPDELMGEMRSSIVFLGAILGRCGQTRLTFPGGCELGPRPIDLHLNALTQMGATIREQGAQLVCQARELTGCEILLPIPSVGATENIMIAASVAKGTTVIRNAAREPEIADLARFINRCGGKVRGYEEGTIVIEGVEQLYGCEHRVIPDRIVATTYLAGVAITGGNSVLRNVNAGHLDPILPVFRQCGCNLTVAEDAIVIQAPHSLQNMPQIVTGYYPGFPTDGQPMMMAMATLAKGTSIFIENIFENRYNHISDLMRMGAKIKVEGRMAVVEGVPRLRGGRVKACDLRGGAALVVAALAAQGETRITALHHLDRGYDALTDCLQAVGACIYRVTE